MTPRTVYPKHATMDTLRTQLQDWMSVASSGILVTSIQVSVLDKPENKVVAEVRIVLNDCIQLTGMKLMSGVHGLFLAYPMEPNQNNELRSVFYPLTPGVRDYLEARALEKYQELKSGGTQHVNRPKSRSVRSRPARNRA
jgi:stage V sporulation protein G